MTSSSIARALIGAVSMLAMAACSAPGGGETGPVKLLEAPVGQLPEGVTPTVYRLSLKTDPAAEGFTGAVEIDTTPEAEAEWNAHAMDTVKKQLRIHDENNWYMGTNVPGKPRAPLVYMGGLGFYRDRCNEIAAEGYRGFVFGYERETAEA